MNIYKLLFGLLLTITLLIPGPYAAAHFGLMAALTKNAWVILLVTTAGLTVKSLAGYVAADGFLFHKFGYDNCGMAFGAFLTALALQIIAGGVDLFPGLSSVAILKDIPQFSSNPGTGRAFQLFFLLVASLAGMFLTGVISGEIKNNKAKKPDFLAFVNFAIGTALFACYVVVLITKG